MRFADALKRLNDVVTNWQPGEQAETCRVRRQDLRELLHHFHRLDDEARQRGIPPVVDVSGDIGQRILGILDDYAGLEPEEGEEWESWSRAAFDLARDRIDKLLAAQPPAQRAAPIALQDGQEVKR